MGHIEITNGFNEGIGRFELYLDFFPGWCLFATQDDKDCLKDALNCSGWLPKSADLDQRSPRNLRWLLQWQTPSRRSSRGKRGRAFHRDSTLRVERPPRRPHHLLHPTLRRPSHRRFLQLCLSCRMCGMHPLAEHSRPLTHILCDTVGNNHVHSTHLPSHYHPHI